MSNQPLDSARLYDAEAEHAASEYLWERLEGPPEVWRCRLKEVTVELWPRPRYCDRGRWQAHIECAEVSLELRPGPGIAIDYGHFGERKGIAGRALQRAYQELDRPLAFSA